MEKIDFENLPSTNTPINANNLNDMQDNIETAINTILPVGIIMPYGSDTIPQNWLLCDGSAVSRTDYATLFSVIGTTYGVGDGSTTFNLPNLKGKVAVGKDTTQTEFDVLGETGGEKAHTLTINEMPSHSHTHHNNENGKLVKWVGGHSGGIAYARSENEYCLNAWADNDGNTDSTGGGQAHNVLQPYITLNYIIKVS